MKSAATRAYPAVRRLLIFRIGSLGDTLVALPSLRRLRAEYPEAKVTLLTNVPVGGGLKAASSFQVLMGCGLVDEFIEYRPSDGPRAMVHLLGRVRALRADKTVYLMPQRRLRQRLRDIVFLSLAGCVNTRGLRFGNASSRRSFNERTGLYESEAARLLRSIGFDGATLEAEEFSLRLTSIERHSAAARLVPGTGRSDIIGISVGTKSASNDWGQENWQTLLKILAQARPRAQIIFIGSADEFERCQQLAQIFSGRFVNFCGQLSPRESGAVLAHCNLFMGHDSGPMHLANAVQTPLIGIFSARNLPGIWFPKGEHAHVFYHAVSCGGCELNVCVAEEMRCIRAISPQDVFKRAIQMLDNTLPQKPAADENFFSLEKSLS